MRVRDKVVVVTGGGSGIGRALVTALLERGARVAAVDLNQEALDETAALLGAGDRLSLHVANITDKATVDALPEAVIAHHGAVDALINNAGIIQPFVPFAELDDKAIERVLDVNLYGTIRMLRAFLPWLSARPEAHIVNVSSMGGFMPFPGQTMYGASKAAVKLLTEGLYAELADTSVSVSVVMPGAVDTHISENSGVTDMPGGDPENSSLKPLPAPEAARIILDGMERDRLHILVGKDALALFTLMRIAPQWSIRFIQRQMKKMLGS
ncbi:MAG: SDR family oxidoreductase [Deltaproteobacteria bacterium]|nr:MAG: SDR family oxidoreductase [Deltaproteobacteria bacterium]